MDPTLIFFAALAAFLTYRLFTVLGTRGGHEPKEQERMTPVPRRTEASDAEGWPEKREESTRPMPDWAVPIREHYAGFDPDEFLDGARSAYEMIVTAFASDDLSEIRPYLDPQVEKTFELAIDGRKHAGQKMETTFVGIEKVEVVDTRVMSRHLEVTVAYQSDQIRVLRNAEGEVIEGDPNRIDLVKDRWTYSRPLDSNDPNWILTATDGAAPTAG